MLYLTCRMISSVELARYGISRAKYLGIWLLCYRAGFKGGKHLYLVFTEFWRYRRLKLSFTRVKFCDKEDLV